MRLYTNAKIVAVETNSAPDKERPGETIEWFTNYLKNSEGGMLKVNSSTSFEEFEGQSGGCSIEVTERQGGGYKLSLKKFSTTDTFDEPEADIH